MHCSTRGVYLLVDASDSDEIWGRSFGKRVCHCEGGACTTCEGTETCP
jgi:hypothetical protein